MAKKEVETVVQLCFVTNGNVLPLGSSFNRNLAYVVSRFIIDERADVKFPDDQELTAEVLSDAAELSQLYRDAGL